MYSRSVRSSSACASISDAFSSSLLGCLLTKRELAERFGVVGKLDGSDRHDDA